MLDSDHRHRTRTNDDLNVTSRTKRRDDLNVRRVHSKRIRRSSVDSSNFSGMLAAAALEKGKIAPLYEDYNGNRMIRLRALQYMVIYDLQRVLAGQVSKIYSTSSAPPELMEKVRKTMKHYGQKTPSLLFPFKGY